MHLVFNRTRYENIYVDINYANNATILSILLNKKLEP